MPRFQCGTLKKWEEVSGRSTKVFFRSTPISHRAHKSRLAQEVYVTNVVLEKMYILYCSRIFSEMK